MKNIELAAKTETEYGDDSYFVASSWTLMRRKFFKHKLAIVGGAVLILFYFMGVLFSGFFCFKCAGRAALYATL